MSIELWNNGTKYMSRKYLNCDLKQGMSAKPAPKNVAKLEENINLHMDMLKENPERLRKYFNHLDIKYAA